jgi:prepilin-type N-terminal cleavage/methylation domain-containing protein
MAKMKLRAQHYSLRDRAFTLIELLAVIAIIGIITGMIVQLAPAVNQNKKRQRVEAEKNKLTLFIDSYQSKFGHYPPDNVNLTAPVAPGVKLPLTANQYDLYTQLNPLLYELAGGINNSNTKFFAFNGSNFSQVEIPNAFGFQGILNADTELQVIYKPLPSPSVYGNYPTWMVGEKNTDVEGLLVPVEMLQTNSPDPSLATTTNFWHYDASSTNRHNPNSYDLWAEFVVGKNKNGWMYVTNGNW